METVLVLTTLPDREGAIALARRLVEERLAACVSVLAPCTSVYHWQGGVETAEETPLLIKTPRCRYEAVERLIRACHPYELPEIVAVAVAGGLPAYLEWVAAETIE